MKHYSGLDKAKRTSPRWWQWRKKRLAMTKQSRRRNRRKRR